MLFGRTNAGLFFAGAVLVAPGVSLAATEIFTTSIPVDGSTFTLGAFDTALGTLTGVTLDLSETASLQIQIFNFGAPDAPFVSATTSTTDTLTGPGGPITGSFFTSAGPGVLPLGDFEQNNLPAALVSDSVSITVANALFANFETAGVGTISYSSQFGPDFTSTGSPGAPGQFFGGDGSLTNGSLKVTYDYTAAAVPEPGAWALMILGFAGAGAMLRRRARVLA